ncbi:MAG: hypothetical protein NZ920_03400 [Aigarchaeota archaeon]|nr:hypothetical protein [Aigarchaeota archaeon]MDW8092335.1 hypothetical protein [Nitrososphaerota archaeon]
MASPDLKRADVVVLGSELTGSLLSHALSRIGYNVLMVDSGSRIAARYHVIPVTRDSLKKIDVRSVSRAVLGACSELNYVLRVGRTEKVTKLSKDVFLLDSNVLCQEILADSDSECVLWARNLKTCKDGRSFSVRCSAPSGGLDIRTSVLVDTLPQSSGWSFQVASGYDEGSEGGCIEIAEGGIRAAFATDNLVAEVSLRGAVGIRCPLSVVKVHVGEVVDEVKPDGALFLGEGAGHIVPPWIGDLAVISAEVGQRLVDLMLTSGDIAEWSRKYSMLASRAYDVSLVAKYLRESRLTDVPLSKFDELLSLETAL